MFESKTSQLSLINFNTIGRAGGNGLLNAFDITPYFIQNLCFGGIIVETGYFLAYFYSALAANTLILIYSNFFGHGEPP